MNRTAYGLLRWAERHSISLMPRFIMGRNTMLANFFSRLNPILGPGWTLNLSVFQKLQRRWPVLIDLFATSLPHRCLPYFSPFHIPNLLGRSFFSNHGIGGRRMLSSLCADSCGSVKAPLVLWGPADYHSSLLAPETLVSGFSGAGSRRAGGSASGQGSIEPASCSSTASGSVKASSSCRETIQRFIRSRGFSRHVAKHAALVRCPSARVGYHAKWSIYRWWCTLEGHSIYRPSLSNFADVLFWLRTSNNLSVSAVLGYRSMISAVFRSVLPEISTSPVLHNLSCGSTC